MNLREGRIGLQEGVCIAAIAMVTSGLFTIDPHSGYANGNATYITLPISILLSALVFFVVTSAMKRSGAVNLAEFLKMELGQVGAAMVSIVLMLFLVIAAYAPLSRFAQAMHGLFFNGVSYRRIIMFILPTVLIVAWMGLETLGRTAKCFSLVLLIILLVTLASAMSEFETYRLYPLMGGDIKHVASQSMSGMMSFLPTVVGLMVICSGLNGIGFTQKSLLIGIAITIIICFITQLALGMVYTYSELEQLYMPLFRINHLDTFEAQLLRLDKLSHMAWLNGGMIAGAFYIYAASMLFTQTFALKDIRPAIGTNALLTVIIMTMEFDGLILKLDKAKDFATNFGFIIVSLPLIIAATIAAIRSKSKGGAKTLGSQ